MASRTRAYELIKETQSTHILGAVTRTGCCPQWSKDFLFQEIYEHSVGLGGARDRA
jgi:hypothetical protein